MTNKLLALYFCLALLAFASCQTNDLPESQSSNSSTSNYESSHEILKPGSYSETSEIEEMESLLSKSDVHISLDAHQGIQYFDAKSKQWNAVVNIEDVQRIIEACEIEESLVHVSTGKTFWEKESAYVETIVEIAKNAGFKTIVVTNDHSSILVIANVFR